MSNKILIRRGLKSALPALSAGEMGLCTDTGQVYIGTSGGNKNISSAVPTIVIAAFDAGNRSKAKADYVCSSLTDTIPFTSALTELGSTGGIIQLTDGTYEFSSPVALNSNITIQGMGDCTVLRQLTNNSKIFTASNRQNIIIKDFQVNLPAEGNFVAIISCSLVTIERINIYANTSFTIPISFTNSSLFTIRDNYISCNDCTTPIFISGGQRAYVYNNKMSGSFESTGMYIDSLRYSIIYNNIYYDLYDCETGIVVGSCKNVMIIGNIIKWYQKNMSASQTSIEAGGTNTNVIIKNNIVDIPITSSGTGIIVIDNYCSPIADFE